MAINRWKEGDYIMSLLDKEKELNQINEKLSVMGSRELLIVHTTIMALYNRQQLDEFEQPQQQVGEPEFTANKEVRKDDRL